MATKGSLPVILVVDVVGEKKSGKDIARLIATHVRKERASAEEYLWP